MFSFCCTESDSAVHIQASLLFSISSPSRSPQSTGESSLAIQSLLILYLFYHSAGRPCSFSPPRGSSFRLHFKKEKMSRNSTKGLRRQNVVKELHKQTGCLQPFKPLIGNRLAEAEPGVAMWFPTVAFSTEFFRSNFDISHNTTMQNQLEPAPQRGRDSGCAGWLEGGALGQPPLRGATPHRCPARALPEENHRAFIESPLTSWSVPWVAKKVMTSELTAGWQQPGHQPFGKGSGSIYMA